MKLSIKSRRFLGILLAIAAAAFILRLAVGFELQSVYSPVTAPSAQTDMYTYLVAANDVVEGSYDYSKGFYYQPFVYSIYLPTIFRIFGKGAHGIIIVQSLLGAATVVICGWLFAMLFGRRCGLIAAALVTVSKFHVFYTPFALIACLQSFWISVIALLAVMAAKRRSIALWGACGVVCGLANVTRGNVILLMPLVIGLGIWSLRLTPRKMTLATSLLVLCFMIPQLPFSIINYQATKKWVGPSTAGGAVLALGNTPEAPPGGREPIYGAGGMAYPPSFGDWVESHKATGVDRVSVGSNVFRWIRREPMAWLELKFRTFLLFWNKMEIPNNVAISQGDQPIPGRLIHLPLLLDFWLIGGLGVAGVGIALAQWRHRQRAAFIACLVLAYSLSIVLFYVLSRFRLPIVPLVCGCAALAIDTLYRQIKRQAHTRRTLVLIGAIVISLIFVGYGYDGYRYGWEGTIHTVVRPNGVQVPLRDRHLIRDNGPFQFGGWEARTATSFQFSKQLKAPRTLSKGVAQACTVRLFVRSTWSGPLVFEINGVRGTVMVQQGARWVEMELPTQTVVKDSDDKIQVSGRIASESAQPFSLFIDNQRDYERTQINGQPIPAELVFELCFFKKTAVE